MHAWVHTVTSVMSNSLPPYSLPGSSVYGNSLGKSTRVGCHDLLQGIFLTQGSDPYPSCLRHWQVGSLPLGSPLQYSCLGNPWTEEPGRLQSIGSQRVGRNWSDLALTAARTGFCGLCQRTPVDPCTHPCWDREAIAVTIVVLHQDLFLTLLPRSWVYAYAKFPADFWEELVIAYAGGCVLDAMQFYAK